MYIQWTISLVAITMASPAMGQWDTCPSLDFQLLNFSGHFRAAQTPAFYSVWLPVQYKPAQRILFCIFWDISSAATAIAYSMNSILFLCVTLKLFTLTSVPPKHQILATPLVEKQDETNSHVVYTAIDSSRTPVIFQDSGSDPLDSDSVQCDMK